MDAIKVALENMFAAKWYAEKWSQSKILSW